MINHAGGNVMEYTITNNAQFNSIEISFDSMPSVEIREALKALRFRWHGVKKVWYGYKDADTVRAAIEGKDGGNSSKAAEKKDSQPEAVNKYGVKVGDMFYSSWGYEQTNVDFFQVVELVGSCSVRVREVLPELIEEEGVCSMSANRTYNTSPGKLLSPCPSSIFIKDQERGDIKRITEGGCFKVSSYAHARRCTGENTRVYESWYY